MACRAHLAAPAAGWWSGASRPNAETHRAVRPRGDPTSGHNKSNMEEGTWAGSQLTLFLGGSPTWFFEANCATIYCYVEATGLVFYN